MNRLSSVLLPVLTLGLFVWVPQGSGQTTRNQMLEASNTARMQARLAESSGYSPEPSRSAAPEASYSPVYSPASNRSYDEKDEDAALAKARRLKEAKRDALGSFGSRNEPVSTGITDGNWQASRLARIREGYYGERKEEPKGALAKLGSALDSIASNEDDYIRRRRAGELDQGFHPLERLSPEVRERSSSEPGLLHKLPEAAGAVTGSLGAAVDGVAGSIGAAAGKLLPSPRPPKEAEPEDPRPSQMSIAPSGNEAMGPAATSSSVIVGTPQPATPGAPKHGLSMPWNRPDRPHPDLQPADTSVTEPDTEPVAKPKAESKRAEASSSAKPAETKSGRVSVPTIGHNRSGRGNPAPDGPLAPEQFRVVQNPAGTEFYPYDNPSPVPKVVPQGGLIEVTKPGSEWSGVVLPDGTEGIIRTSMLRRARISEMPKEAFEEPAIPTPAASAKSIDSNGTTNAPLPDLPKPGETSLPLGQGLLPPLQPDN